MTESVILEHRLIGAKNLVEERNDTTPDASALRASSMIEGFSWRGEQAFFFPLTRGKGLRE